MRSKNIAWILVLVLCCLSAFQPAEARRRHHHRHHRYHGPPPTHPVILWARTLSESNEPQQRKIAAFKLSQYSQPIFQDQVIVTLLKCMKDPDREIKILCTKALGTATAQAYTDSIRKSLLDQYAVDESLKNTIVRTFIRRKDSAPKVQDTFMEQAMTSNNPDELIVLLSYFEKFGSGSSKFVENLVTIYQKQENIKVKRAVVKVLADRAEGQSTVIDLLSQCAQNKDTPLALTCLGGLQSQARKDPRAWSAVEKTILSEDPDVLMASLDVINALPASKNQAITDRLVALSSNVDDSEIQEKAVLALGVCGTQSESVVDTLLHLLEEKDTDDSVRIASALILGKQATAFPDKALAPLQQCGKDGALQSLRTACQLGLQELQSHQVTLKPSPSPAAVAAKPSPASSPAAAASPSPVSSPSPAAAVTVASPSPAPVAAALTPSPSAISEKEQAAAPEPANSPSVAPVSDGDRPERENASEKGKDEEDSSDE